MYLDSFVDRDMMMRFRGGGVGHTSTRTATDWFLKDRDKLDMASEMADEGRNEDGEPFEDDDNEAASEGLGRVKGDGVAVDEVEEVDGDEDCDIDEDEIDEELDYGYALDEEVAEESEEEYQSDDLVDDALGAEDGEEAEDELYSLGFGTL
jgi:hypothetical protein